VLLILAVQTLTVFAAASLHLAFPALGKQFEAAHPGVTVRFSFNGSQILEAQLAAGAPGDVFASADKRWMDKAVEDGIVTSGAAFASNQLVAVARPASGVVRPRDLGQPGIKLVVCAQAVPCGAYARQLLRAMSAVPAYGSDFADRVLGNVVSDELDVEAVLAKVSLGEADAGIVYRTDAMRQTTVRIIDLPALTATPIGYFIGVARASSAPALASQFADFVRSAQGQKTLDSFGFSPAP
jgi:molybdate transport system substrate-binding protein